MCRDRVSNLNVVVLAAAGHDLVGAPNRGSEKGRKGKNRGVQPALHSIFDLKNEQGAAMRHGRILLDSLLPVFLLVSRDLFESFLLVQKEPVFLYDALDRRRVGHDDRVPLRLRPATTADQPKCKTDN